jgi:hypothetical protein
MKGRKGIAATRSRLSKDSGSAGMDQQAPNSIRVRKHSIQAEQNHVNGSASKA